MADRDHGLVTKQTVGYRTSIDLAQGQVYQPTTSTGVKRNHSGVELAVTRSPREEPVVADVKAGSVRTDFRRPSMGSSFRSRTQIMASEIVELKESAACDLQTEYSQRRTLASTPGPLQNPLLSLSHPRYGLPEALVQSFASLGISSMYPWQSSCLLGHGLLDGKRNLVYTAPTGGGKSLVADVLMLKRIIDDPSKKAILVLPYVALVQEKLRWLRRLVERVEGSRMGSTPAEEKLPSWRRMKDEMAIRVVGFFGGSKARASWADVDIAANAMVNNALGDGTINALGVVVLDELHLIDDDHRGYLMELMATKLLSLDQGTQIIGMSATLSNTQMLADWLDAKYYESKYRPIPIEEFLVYENAIYPAATSSSFLKTVGQVNAAGAQQTPALPCRSIRASTYRELEKPLVNAVVALTNETVRHGYGVLVFCSSRAGCEIDAALISRIMPAQEELEKGTWEARLDMLGDLRNTSVGLEKSLERCVQRGVAYHHAGLTSEEREIIANGYDRGIIKVIVATCSLAAGINLPARRVILHGARMGRDLVGPAMLRQMRGRAGRKGKDEIGESYICCQKSDLEAVCQLIEADLPVVTSCLTPTKRGISRTLLEIISVRLATTLPSITDHVKRTLLHRSTTPSASTSQDLTTIILSALSALITDQLITHDATVGTYAPTLLGSAVTSSSLSPSDGIFIHSEMTRALHSFVMSSEMHIFYMFTPPTLSTSSASLSTTINFPIFRDELSLLPPTGLLVATHVGVSPSLVNRLASSGSLPLSTPEEQLTARIYQRFYTALQLRDLCNEIPLHAVAAKYDVSRGAIQNLSQTCQGFAAGMIKFAERMGRGSDDGASGWGMLAAVLTHMSDRLAAGARADLLDLARVSGVKSKTARVLWENGVRSVRQLAEMELDGLIPILLMAQPRKSHTDRQEEERWLDKVRAKAEMVIRSAEKVWERDCLIDIEE